MTTGGEKKVIRLVVISHALSQETPRERWRLLARDYPVEVTLLVPKTWRSSWLRKADVYHSEPIHEGRFKVLPMATTSTRKWSKYLFLSPNMRLPSIQPDIIFTVHEESIWIHQQVITYRNLWSPTSKAIFFSMNALGMRQEKWHQRLRWKRVKNNYDAAIGHYPGCLDSLRNLGFEKPLFMQTQIGVDGELYYPDEELRKAMRKRLGLEDRFVIGFAGRLVEEKGILDLLEALPIADDNWSLLLVGDGRDRETVEEIVAQREWGERVVVARAVPQQEVASHMRAMDCLVLGSRTIPGWIDTFPNVTVQAMACSVPVIGSDSGAIPYQLGNAGLLFKEGDIDQLHTHLNTLSSDPELRDRLGTAGRERCFRMFEVKSLNSGFYDIIQQVQSGRYRKDLEGGDMRRAW